MKKEHKKQIMEIIARNASDDYLAGYLNGYKAAKDKETMETKEPQIEKKPA